jgi:hypothetical protein
MPRARTATISARFTNAVVANCEDEAVDERCEHDWRPCGYVLSYRPGGRRYTAVCARCGEEASLQDVLPDGITDQRRGEIDRALERGLLG